MWWDWDFWTWGLWSFVGNAAQVVSLIAIVFAITEIIRDRRPLSSLNWSIDAVSEERSPEGATSLRFFDVSRLQCLQVQSHGRDGRFQFVRNGIDKGVVLFVTPDLPDQEDRVENDAGDDETEEEDAEDK